MHESLIMASCVGSFMLSNPMRGRAVRVDPDNPEKTGAIWHLACVDVEQNQGGHDLSSLSRGFRSLVGLSADHDSIKSGIGRMGLRLQPLNERTIRENNENTLERARNRHLLRDRWNRAVAVHEEGRMTEEIRIPKARVPKPYHFGNTIRSLVVTALTAFVGIFTDSLMNMVRHSDDMRTITSHRPAGRHTVPCRRPERHSFCPSAPVPRVQHPGGGAGPLPHDARIGPA